MGEERTARVSVEEGARVARALELIDEAARPRPLPEVLGALCAEVAAILEAPVASCYVRERDPAGDRLVLRANEGLPGTLVDRVELRVGEGITGFAAELLRPVTLEVASADAHYVPVPGLDEEELPVFLALPILVGRRAEAVLVLQRRAGHPFTPDEVLLASALASSFAYALERARQRSREEDASAPRRAELRGEGLVRGVAIGRVETVPTFAGLAALARKRGLVSDGPLQLRVEQLHLAFDQLGRSLEKVRARLAEAMEEPDRVRLATLSLLWQDRRLREQVAAHLEDEPNPVRALGAVARTYARAPYDLDGPADPSSTDRAAEVEALCMLLAARVVDERCPSAGAALALTEGVPAMLALAASAHRASGLAVGAPVAGDHLAVAIARAAGIPLLAGVAALFAWVRVGDLVILDAREGRIRVNPTASTVAAFRKGGA